MPPRRRAPGEELPEEMLDMLTAEARKATVPNGADFVRPEPPPPSNKSCCGASREPPTRSKKLTSILIIVFLSLAGVTQFMLTFYETFAGAAVQDVDVGDEAGLRRALLSGEPHIVYCIDEGSREYAIAKVVKDYAELSYQGVRSVRIDCKTPLPSSGRSVAQRYGYASAPTPFALFVANGDRPRPLQLGGISKYEAVEKQISAHIAPSVKTAGDLKRFQSHCKSRSKCLVVAHRGPEQKKLATSILEPQLVNHRSTRVVTVDLNKWSLKLGEQLAYLIDKSQKQPMLLCARKSEDTAESQKAEKGKEPAAGEAAETRSPGNSKPKKMMLGGKWQGDWGDRAYEAVEFLAACDDGSLPRGGVKIPSDGFTMKVRREKTEKKAKKEEAESAAAEADEQGGAAEEQEEAKAEGPKEAVDPETRAAAAADKARERAARRAKAGDERRAKAAQEAERLAREADAAAGTDNDEDEDDGVDVEVEEI